MTDLLVTADTNILASGLVRSHTRPDAAPVRFVHSWLDGRFILTQSAPLLDELGRTLTKPYVAQRLGESDRGTFLRLVEQQARLTPITEVVTGVW
jgi:predicted nucleic acid-binding protein